MDIVPNHVSAAHVWFVQALADGPGSAARQHFWFRPGRGPSGEAPPNPRVSIFGGPAWTRVLEADGTPGEWYLHLFAPEQPDLNWGNAEVRAEHEDVLRFWFDRGAAGVRIDSAALLVKDPALPELPVSVGAADPHTDRDELHEIYRSWRRIAESYPVPRILVGELWLPDAERFARYLRRRAAHRLQLRLPRLALGRSRAADLDRHHSAVHAPVSAPATWVLSNHDVTRPSTRYGRADTSFAFEAMQFGVESDEPLGRRRARAAALLATALPGAMYIYQGEELGLPEVDLPRDRLQDPMYHRSNGTRPGRDGCRVPLPWSGEAPPYGFSPAGSAAEPWLPQPADWAGMTVSAEQESPSSMLSLYRQGLGLRRHRWATERPPWCGSTSGSPTTQRIPRQLVGQIHPPSSPSAAATWPVWSTSAPAPLPSPPGEVLLTSGPLIDGLLPPDTTAWLGLGTESGPHERGHGPGPTAEKTIS